MEWRNLTNERMSLVSSVEDGIRKALVAGHIKPGERLVEAKIAKDMGISRAPVREAFRILEQQGLITISPRKGAYVTAISRKDVEEVFSLREVLECFAIRQAIEKQTFSTSDLAHMQELVDEMGVSPHINDPLERLRPDIEFHRLIWKKSNHCLLLECLINLEPRMQRLMMVTDLYDHQGDVAAHQVIVDAVRKGDVDLAVESVRQHIIGAKGIFVGTVLSPIVEGNGDR